MRLFWTALILMSVGFGGFAMAETPQEALNRGDIAGATGLLAAMSESEDVEDAVAGLAGQAQIAIHNGDYDKAASLLDQAEEKLGERRLAKSGYHVVVPYLKSEVAQAQGQMDLAKALIKLARANFDLGLHIDDLWEGVLEYKMSQVFDDDNAQARHAAEAAIDFYRSRRMYAAHALAEIRLAELEWARDKHRRTFVGYDNALRAYRNEGNSQDKIAEIQLMIAEKHIKLEDFKAAASRLEMAQKEMELAGNPAALQAKFKELQQALPE